MSLPIGAYGLLVALFGLISAGSGMWLVFRARDVARLIDTPEADVVTGPARRPPASRRKTQAVMIIFIVSSIATLGTFALIAARVVDSDNTRTEPNAQRP